MHDEIPHLNSTVIFNRDLHTARTIETSGLHLSLRDQVNDRIKNLLESLDQKTPFPTISETRLDVGTEGALIGGAARHEAVASAMTGTSLPPVKTVAQEVRTASAEKPIGKATINLVITASPTIELNEALLQRMLQIILLSDKTAEKANLHALNPHLRFSNTDFRVYVLKQGMSGTTLYRIRRENNQIVVDSLNKDSEKSQSDLTGLMDSRKQKKSLTGAQLESLLSANMVSLGDLTQKERERLKIWKTERIKNGIIPERQVTSSSFAEEYVRILEEPEEENMKPNYIPAATEILVAGIVKEIQDEKSDFKLVITDLPIRGLEHIIPDELNDNVIVIPSRGSSWPPQITSLPKKEKAEIEEDLFDE